MLVGPTPVADKEQNLRIERFSKGVTSLCTKLPVPSIEIYEQLNGEARWIQEMQNGDGSHPGSIGYSELATIVSKSPAWMGKMDFPCWEK